MTEIFVSKEGLFVPQRNISSLAELLVFARIRLETLAQQSFLEDSLKIAPLIHLCDALEKTCQESLISEQKEHLKELAKSLRQQRLTR